MHQFNAQLTAVLDSDDKIPDYILMCSLAEEAGQVGYLILTQIPQTKLTKFWLDYQTSQAKNFSYEFSVKCMKRVEQFE